MDRQIACDIIDRALAHGVSVSEFVTNCGDIEAAADEIIRWYVEGDGQDAEFKNIYGEIMSANSAEFRRYVEAGLEMGLQ